MTDGLDGLRQRRRVRQLVVGAGEVVGLADRRRPQPGDDLELLGELLEALLGVRERDAVGGVLLGEPAGADAQLDPAVAHRVDARDLDREHAGVAERHAGHQGAEPDGRGVAGEARQRGPGVGGPGHALAAHRQVVVGAEERTEAELLGGAGDGEEVVVRRALLRLGHHAELN